MKNVEVVMRLWYNFFIKIIHPDHMNFMGLKYMAVTAIYAAATIIYMETIVIYYRSITDTVITETSGGDRMAQQKLGQTRSDNVIKKEMISRRSRQQTWCSDSGRSKTGSFVWWKVQNHRFSA